jgi:hypothetical protein
MNNSQKLDYIINQLKKLDQHDIYFQEIREDISKLNIRVSKIEKKISEMDITLKNLDGYRKRNNNSIELEVTKAVFENLKENEKSLYIIDVSSIFPKKYKNETNSIFIEIDGLILGTNDREYASKYNKSFTPRIKENEGFELSKNLLPKIYKLYIIEGKHNITKQKVIDKYAKYNKFKLFLSNIKNNQNIYTQKIKNIIEKFQLYLFDPENIILIFGTPMWNEEAKQQILKYMDKDPNVRMVVLSGNRYNL